MKKPILMPGDSAFYRGCKVIIRRTAFYMGKVEYWILLPDRNNSYAWISEKQIEAANN